MFDNIILPVLIVTATGLLAGLILAVASHFFDVPENEKAKAILEYLPGANCAACGYAGCEDYAKALSEGKAKSNLCAPGGSKTASSIAKLLGTEEEAVIGKVAFVKCQGSRNDERNKLLYRGIRSCKGVSMYFGGKDYCTYGCIGLGDCVSSCPFNAISIKNGIAFVDPRTCTGCGICISACPKNIIALATRDQKARIICNNKDKGGITKSICSEGCIGCGICVRNCEADAIKIVNFMAVIDADKCTSCGKCIEVCPEKVISF